MVIGAMKIAEHMINFKIENFPYRKIAPIFSLFFYVQQEEETQRELLLF